MPPSRSANALLAAIEGYRGEHGSSSEHEPIMAQLDRVMQDVRRGSGTPQDSPGRREATSAATAAHQRTMTAEEGHDGGDGNATSNQPGEARAAVDSDHPVIHGPDGRDDKLSGATVQHSLGNLRSQLPGPGMAPGTAEIRRIAAAREMSRPDSHMADRQNRGDNNRRSMPPGDAPANTARIGNVAAPPARANPSATRTHAETTARTATENQPEPAPTRVPQQGNPFSRASQQARERLRKSR